MASFFTNKGLGKMLTNTFDGGTVPTNYYAYCVTSSATPTVDDDTWSDHSANESSNYTEATIAGGTGFGTISVDDTNDWATLTVNDIVFTASADSLVARWVIITDDNGTEANREIYAVLDLTSERTVGNGQTLTATGTTLKLSQS
jgi:hypothetical protein